MHAEVCPICKGSGKIQKIVDVTVTIPMMETCNGCGGKGWVQVDNSTNNYPQSFPTTPPWPYPYPYWPILTNVWY